MIVLLFGLLAAPMQTAERMRVETVWAGTNTMTITVPPGRCRFVLNGRPIALTRLRKEARGWAETQPEVHFEPSPEAEYRCVDRVLRVLREASVTKLGFVGNEQVAGDQP